MVQEGLFSHATDLDARETRPFAVFPYLLVVVALNYQEAKTT
jgi:hypothetical protein